MNKGEIINLLKEYSHKKMNKFLGSNAVSDIFQSEITENNYITQNKILANYDLLSIKSFVHFIIKEQKMSSYTEIKLSDVFIELYKDHNINFNENIFLYKNLCILENWANNLNDRLAEYGEDKFQDQLIDSIHLNQNELKILLSDQDVQSKLFNEEQILKLKEIAHDREQDRIETIRLLNKAIALKLSTLDFNNMTYYLFKKFNDQQLEIQTYDQLTKFELYCQL